MGCWQNKAVEMDTVDAVLVVWCKNCGYVHVKWKEEEMGECKKWEWVEQEWLESMKEIRKTVQETRSVSMDMAMASGMNM